MRENVRKRGRVEERNGGRDREQGREVGTEIEREGWGACGGRVGSIVDGLDLGERKRGTEGGSAF